MGYFIHAANILYLVSYLVRDILWLRLLTIVAALTLMPYFYFQPDILWPPILWNALFIGINVYQVHQLLRERRPIDLSEAEQRLYALAFSRLTQRQFKRLFQAAAPRNAAADERLIEAGTDLSDVLVVFDGEVVVEEHDSGDELAVLGPGCLIGEMGLVTGQPPSADVVARTPATLYAWPYRRLEQLFDKDASLKSQWQAIVIGDLTSKLRKPLGSSGS